MERTTLYLDAAAKRLLKAAARRRGVAEAVIVREALAAYLKAEGNPRPRVVGKSKDGGVARRFDSALTEAGFGGRSDR
jgi:hypothetical protein